MSVPLYTKIVNRFATSDGMVGGCLGHVQQAAPGLIDRACRTSLPEEGRVIIPADCVPIELRSSKSGLKPDHRSHRRRHSPLSPLSHRSGREVSKRVGRSFF